MEDINQDKTQTKKTKFDELRKAHPKAFMRWTKVEDELLLDSYNRGRGASDFELEIFLEKSSSEMGRRPNGIRGRLAKFFPDIAGWDYEGQKQRDEERKNKRAEAKTSSSDDYRQQSAKPDDPASLFNFSNNPEAQIALKILLETDQNLFLTGEAGTGKSTLLQYFRQKTDKNIVVLAPTGVAALNVQGQTIHSFCAFGPDITLQKVKRLSPWSGKKKLLEKLNTIVIDEISMVRADLLDCVDKFLRINGPANLPFGGLQMVFIGDLHQLPPVDKDFGAGDGLIKQYQSPYFFDSNCFKTADFNFVQLKTMYRQTDRVFIEALNAVRNNLVGPQHLELFNQRVAREENQPALGQSGTPGAGFAIYLTPTNSRARLVNNFFLDKISSDLISYQGQASGSFEDRELPTDLDLQFKVGAQVMLLNNDGRKRWVNGTMGKIAGVEKAKTENNSARYSPPFKEGVPGAAFLSQDEHPQKSGDGGGGNFQDSDDEPASSDIIIVELETGETVRVEPYTWEMFKFVLDKDTQAVDSQTTGRFTQYPFKLAWAVTIHKAQGKTFDKVYLDLSTGAFAHGQLYVALSRCRTLEGLHLRRPIQPKDILLDERIVKFLESLQLVSSKNEWQYL